MPCNKIITEQDVITIEGLETKPKESSGGRQPRVYPVLPVRDQVYFPNMLFPLLVGREKSIRSLDEAISKNRKLVLVAQKEIGIEDPEPSDLYEVGVLVEVMQVLRVPDGAVRLMLEGLERVRIVKYVQEDPFLKARVRVVSEKPTAGIEIEALRRSIIDQFEQVVQNGRQIPPEAMITVISMTDPARLADTIAYHLGIPVASKQEILEVSSVRERLDKLNLILAREVEILEIHRNIRSRVEKEMGETQKEFILREQLKAIQQELGDRDERGSEIEEYKTKIEEARMPVEVAERALKEVDRLEKMPYAAPDGVVVRTYLDWLISLPWDKSTVESLEIEAAQNTLDEDHYGLFKVKERILEFLAVRKLAGTMRGPILCFVGPPGVGKTSIGKSIARALGRKFIRVSLGGIRDEAEIRGHRRTYIGSLPGRIIQGIKQAGFRNPVFMLDEIDKIGADFRGDPSAALLEALDPEQNNAFSDHYLEVPFDLSDVMFITTANVLDTIPPPLRDRMEVIHFPGYIEDEKLEIAKRFLVPKQTRENGLSQDNLVITEAALRRLIREYTREAGVRNLEREIATICRKVAKRVAEGSVESMTVDDEDVKTFLGTRKYHYGMAEEKDEVAAATGLVYTEFGGDIIQIEVGILKATEGKLLLTGQLGDVMKESAQAALTYVRSKARALDIDEEFSHRTDIHIHVPAGAVPKDGPSAGITIATALASALTRRKVRKDVAMTGEITLRGRVLPIGGVKEKVLAAHRAGIKTVIMPKENEKDLEEIPENVLADLTIKLVEHADEVLAIALLNGESDRKPAI
ncbi:MAG TPA: endopeptidase La [Armatimonadota bacterium]|jgi:ATP-dependent Lon protease|nr:endopeptidase La [Armatimonadota bacterium]